MARLRLFIIAGIALALAACPEGTPPPGGFPENTIAFTLDGVDYSYSFARATEYTPAHAWGTGWGGDPPTWYELTASATADDAEAGTYTIVIFIDSEVDYYLEVRVHRDMEVVYNFYLGSADRVMLENVIRNIDDVGEQMQGAFLGPYYYYYGEEPPETHTLENLIFSVERLSPPPS